MRQSTLILGFLAIIMPSSMAGEPAAKASAPNAFFENEIRPLLAEHCFKCHGEKKQKGGLRLDSREAMLKGGDTAPAVVPGKADQSLLIKAISYQGELKMPREGKLSDAKIAKFKRWIDFGAPWPGAPKVIVVAGGKFQVTEAHRRWWAFQRVKPTSPPNVKNRALVRSDIDRFILGQLESRGMSMAGPADKRTLIRRTTFDLTGLPPTPEEVEAFLRDDSEKAFENVVNRLLASPASRAERPTARPRQASSASPVPWQRK